MLLTVFVTVVTLVGDRNDALRRNGISVAGTVTKLTADSGFHPGRVWVSYPGGARTLVGSVDAGSDVSRFHLGETVTVYYDVRHPSRMTTADEDNQSAWSVQLTILMLVFGVFAVGLGFITVLIRIRRRWRRTPAGTRVAQRVRRVRSRAVIGRPSPVTVLIGIAGVGFTVAMTVAEARNGAVSFARAVGDAAGSGAVAALLFLLASCRVIVDGAAHCA